MCLLLQGKEHLKKLRDLERKKEDKYSIRKEETKLMAKKRRTAKQRAWAKKLGKLRKKKRR